MNAKHRFTFLLLDFLDLAEDFIFLASKPGMTRMSRYWGYTEQRDAYRAFERWEAEQYIEKQQRGSEVVYRIGKAGQQFLQQQGCSPAQRRRAWDRRWRMVMFDFPEVARKARDAFRRELKMHRMGCLQKSVWITPDPVIADWNRLLADLKLTEWVLLFESAEHGPVEDKEIAFRVWKLDEVGKRYTNHLARYQNLPQRLSMCRAPVLPAELAAEARRERREYFGLLREDPLLPMPLLPKAFAGLKADELHAEIRSALRRCLLADKP